jgi:hypothetical protein
MPVDAVLTPGEWEALLFQAPEQVRALVYKLAVYHGAVERSQSADCPLCGTHRGDQAVLNLVPDMPDKLL